MFPGFRLLNRCRDYHLLKRLILSLKLCGSDPSSYHIPTPALRCLFQSCACCILLKRRVHFWGCHLTTLWINLITSWWVSNDSERLLCHKLSNKNEETYWHGILVILQVEMTARTSTRSQWIKVWTASWASACVAAQSTASASLSVRWRTTAQQVD